jgi:hypothetical protein
MPVYVSEIRERGQGLSEKLRRRFGSRWAKLSADTPEELHEFAKAMGLGAAGVRLERGCDGYELTPGQRARALKFGARGEGRGK